MISLIFFKVQEYDFIGKIFSKLHKVSCNRNFTQSLLQICGRKKLFSMESLE